MVTCNVQRPTGGLVGYRTPHRREMQKQLEQQKQKYREVRNKLEAAGQKVLPKPAPPDCIRLFWWLRASPLVSV